MELPNSNSNYFNTRQLYEKDKSIIKERETDHFTDNFDLNENNGIKHQIDINFSNLSGKVKVSISNNLTEKNKMNSFSRLKEKGKILREDNDNHLNLVLKKNNFTISKSNPKNSNYNNLAKKVKNNSSISINNNDSSSEESENRRHSVIQNKDYTNSNPLTKNIKYEKDALKCKLKKISSLFEKEKKIAIDNLNEYYYSIKRKNMQNNSLSKYNAMYNKTFYDNVELYFKDKEKSNTSIEENGSNYINEQYKDGIRKSTSRFNNSNNDIDINRSKYDSIRNETKERANKKIKNLTNTNPVFHNKISAITPEDYLIKIKDKIKSFDFSSLTNKSNISKNTNNLPTSLAYKLNNNLLIDIKNPLINTEMEETTALELYFIQQFEKDKNNELEKEFKNQIGRYEDDKNYNNYSLYNLSNYSNINEAIITHNSKNKYKVTNKSNTPYLNQQIENDLYVRKLKLWDEKHLFFGEEAKMRNKLSRKKENTNTDIETNIKKNTYSYSNSKINRSNSNERLSDKSRKKENTFISQNNNKRKAVINSDIIISKNNNLNTSELSTKKRYINENLENLNWVNNLKKKIDKIKTEYKGKSHFTNFYEADKEEATMFQQIIGISRRKFQIVLPQEIVEKCMNKNIFATFGIKLNGISLEEIRMLGYYQSIVNKKSTLEKAYRKEVMLLLQNKFEYTKRVEDLTKENKNIILELNTKKDHYYVRKRNIVNKINNLKAVNNKLSLAFKDEAVKKNYNINEYIKMINKNKREILDSEKALETLNKEENKLKLLNNSKYDENIELITSYQKEISLIKKSIDSLFYDQIIYYSEMLNKGFDVRKEGLCWIVKRLIELKIKLNANHFPQYLNNSHIEYLINIAYKELECSQYRIILKGLKIRQQKLNEKSKDALDLKEYKEKDITVISRFKGKSANYNYNNSNNGSSDDIYGMSSRQKKIKQTSKNNFNKNENINNEEEKSKVAKVVKVTTERDNSNNDISKSNLKTNEIRDFNFTERLSNFKRESLIRKSMIRASGNKDSLKTMSTVNQNVEDNSKTNNGNNENNNENSEYYIIDKNNTNNNVDSISNIINLKNTVMNFSNIKKDKLNSINKIPRSYSLNINNEVVSNKSEDSLIEKVEDITKTKIKKNKINSNKILTKLSTIHSVSNNANNTNHNTIQYNMKIGSNKSVYSYANYKNKNELNKNLYNINSNVIINNKDDRDVEKYNIHKGSERNKSIKSLNLKSNIFKDNNNLASFHSRKKSKFNFSSNLDLLESTNSFVSKTINDANENNKDDIDDIDYTDSKKRNEKLNFSKDKEIKKGIIQGKNHNIMKITNNEINDFEEHIDNNEYDHKSFNSTKIKIFDSIPSNQNKNSKNLKEFSNKSNINTNNINSNNRNDIYNSYENNKHKITHHQDSFNRINQENLIKKNKIRNFERLDFSYQNEFFKQENLLINVAIDKIKRKMLTFANDDGVFEIDVTNDIRLASYFEESMISQEYFKEILRIRRKIENLEKEITNIKNEQLLILKNKTDIIVKNSNVVKIVEADLIYAAIFGLGL